MLASVNTAYEIGKSWGIGGFARDGYKFGIEVPRIDFGYVAGWLAGEARRGSERVIVIMR